MQKLIEEKNAVSDECRTAQESLRLSTAAQSKLNHELQHYKDQIEANNRDSETYRQKMRNLMSENSNLNEEVRGAQENLRLSAGTISKLNNELKITCNENEELKRRLQEITTTSRKTPELEAKVALLSQEIERLNSILDKKNG